MKYSKILIMFQSLNTMEKIIPSQICSYVKVGIIYKLYMQKTKFFLNFRMHKVSNSYVSAYILIPRAFTFNSQRQDLYTLNLLGNLNMNNIKHRSRRQIFLSTTKKAVTSINKTKHIQLKAHGVFTTLSPKILHLVQDQKQNPR